jgi:signal transduction histidine kinase
VGVAPRARSLSRWLDPFVDPSTRTGQDQVRASRTAAVSLVVLASTPVFAMLMAQAGFVASAAALLAFGAGFVVPLVALRRGASPAVAGTVAWLNGAGLWVYATWSTTGPSGASAIPALLLPVAATLLVGPRAGWLGLVATGATLVILSRLDQTGWAAVAGGIDPNRRALSFALVLTAVGGVVQASISAMVQLDARHRRLLDATLDDLERRVAERTRALEREVVERRAAEEAAQRGNRAKSVFLANMSHELRTPLNAILGYTELVTDELEQRPELQRHLGRVHDSARHLLRLIEDVLDLARVEHEQLELRLVEVELPPLLEECSALVGPQFAQRGNSLELRCPPGARSAWGDRDRVRQIVVNLLSNANKFTDRGQVTVTVTGGEGLTAIEVADTGVGIAPEWLDRVFDRFVQADDAPTRTAGGAGLGLAIARELTQRMGGALTVSSRVGSGSTFRLELPQNSTRAPS